MGDVNELIVVGAGLHALTLLCGLREPRPMCDALVDAAGGVTRSRKSERLMRAELKKRRRDASPGRVVVVDSHGTWLTNWRRQFGQLRIEVLRSNAALHPDPFDPEMLIEFARMQGYSPEEAFVEITDVPRGKDFVGPFQLPKTNCFNHFADALIAQYGLKEVLMKGEVKSVTSEKGRLRVWLEDGRWLDGERVVMAMGHTHRPRLPDWVDRTLYPVHALAHVWELVHQKVPSLRGERVAVVGGGLTSVQLVEVALQSGAQEVCLISRAQLRVRPFDSDLTWSGRRRQEKLQKFWNEQDVEKRLQMIKEARRGGTVTPAAHRRLMDLMQSGQCHLLEGVEVWDAEWEGNAFRLELSHHDDLRVEKLWLATGSLIDVTAEPCLAELREQFALRSCGGYPILDATLKWHPDLELYFMGAYSSLALGPDGINLAGARRAAFRLRSHFRSNP